MIDKKIKKELADTAKASGLIFISTADKDGLSHIAVAGKFNFTEDEKIAISQWFCPKTLENLAFNKRISIVVWDKQKNAGFQIAGEVERMEEENILDGYIPGKEEPVTQVERELFIDIKAIFSFRKGIHRDA
ncbi:MAG: pyridoxamine 5'-phosphate oxidase family protein [Candidatus Omnitrophica bacterium]|nr:pyridoxamine 5'-phosphate oxidase family protein [Candidatus Omnitrophota bacterium]